MDFTLERSTKIVAWLLIAMAVTQAIYTGIYIGREEGLFDFAPPRQLLWGGEAVLFLAMAAFAAQPLVQAKAYFVGWGAIFTSAILNFMQVGIGLLQFGPFRAASEAYEGADDVAFSVIAYSFFVYNGAKVLLGFAALIFGMAKFNAGGKALGALAAIFGVLAMISNAVVMTGGLDYALGSSAGGLMPAGATGVIATVLLALCLSSAAREES